MPLYKWSHLYTKQSLKRMSRAGTSIAHLAQRLIDIHTGLPVKDETSETTVQNVFCMLPILKIPVL